MQEASKSGTPDWLKHKLPSGLAGAAFWLALWFALLFALRRMPGALGTFFAVIQVFVGISVVEIGRAHV